MFWRVHTFPGTLLGIKRYEESQVSPLLFVYAGNVARELEPFENALLQRFVALHGPAADLLVDSLEWACEIFRLAPFAERVAGQCQQEHEDDRDVTPRDFLHAMGP